MRRLRLGNSALNKVLLLYLTLSFSGDLVWSITVNTPAELHASKGDTVTLSCTFSSTSPPTSKMSVDWAYRPQTGGPPHTFFHFSSRVFPPSEGQFSGRIKWKGSPARGDSSIALINATLNDNGTYTCTVRNPPDVHGAPTSHSVLTVTPKAPSIRFSDVTLLLAFILLPSALLTFFLIGRVLCPKKQRSKSKSLRSPIEVTEGEEFPAITSGGTPTKATCCELCFMDPDEEEEYYYNLKQRRSVEEEQAESKC
ncbi:myelin protein zero-like protein 3 [Eucyclogobius newberryi]|uniref:myelin protein zero-like protein 3 n=1 Tax=Eucyclogobius newberryi TaxID=166745 RepID=UPI003B5BACAF